MSSLSLVLSQSVEFQSFSSSESEKRLSQHSDSHIEIVGGNISCNRHIIAGNHSQIGTQSAGAHLKTPSSSTHTHSESEIFQENNIDDKFKFLEYISE
jgi:hypothetical protein